MAPSASPEAAARSWGPPIAAALIAGLLGLASGFFSKEAMSPAEIIPAGERMDGITIDPVASGTVPRCARLAGSAEQIDGYVPWVALRGLGSDEFYFAKPARDAARPLTWRLSVTVGAAKPETAERFDLYAFYLSEAESRFIGGLTGFGDDGRPGYFSAATLPFELPDKPSVSIIRQIDGGPACR